jgi:PTS system nitrogen regulatory IIA component
MQLSVHEAAELLQVSEEMIYKRIKDGSLPSYSISGQHRFNRTELLEWATANGLSFAPGAFRNRSEDEEEEEPIPLVSEALEAGGIHYDLAGGTPETTLEAIVRILPFPPHVDRTFLLDVLLAREALGSTAVGDGIAIPHVRNPIVLDTDERPILSLAFLREPVDFGALDGVGVFALFTLVCPTIRVHLQMLSRLAFVLSDPAFREEVRKRADAQQLLAAARRAESRIRGPKGGHE